ncbi:MAG: class I SAM-dependent rRNA methyltransferase [Candidatus Kapabacteria bacterium]|nr:class I SAM-dependent rRNA methyltransferase [Candidatus Kapabacteria bacterium]MCS7302881.1 class I SAM-dependent rRNA methyltransferase [Candidatus Kapabacteria bacterium]
MPFPSLRLRPGAHRRLRSGHLWVYRDELEHPSAPLAAGDVVRVQAAHGGELGVGFYHPTSKIAVRLLLWNGDADAEFFLRRFERALALRRTFYGQEQVYRLVFGEADFLPGLIVDRYGEYLAVQYLSVGMDRRSDIITETLRQLLPETRGIIAKNDSVLREKEGLPRTEMLLWGSIPERLELTINGLVVYVDLVGGQKTGLYLDQRANYTLVARFAQGRRVLDCFTHQGGFALHCARSGARQVVGVDSSASAIALARQNAERNNLSACCDFVEADVFDYLKAAVARGERWDMVILDPPAFAKSVDHIERALRGYAEINRRALQLLGDGGILVTASCSHYISERMLAETVVTESKRAGCRVRLIARGMQSPCHPIYAPMPETEYLKLLVFEVVRLASP